MALKTALRPDRLDFEQLAGFTGFGWTASTLGFMSTLLGNGLVTRLVTEPQSFLYVGLVCFLATLGLDRLANTDEE